nr:GNAT family N-acetyltransferase [Vibrio eleionomae]
MSLEPRSEDIDAIYQGLGGYNQKFVPEITDESFALLVRNDLGEVVGGLTGFIYISCVQIRFLWLDDALRKQGVGSQLMAQVEQLCEQRNISNIAVDTYTFQAPTFYEKHGYQEIGRYPDYLVPGIDKIFYYKVL